MDLARHQPLLDAARAGDVAAIERLLAACQPDIRRYAQRNCLVSDVDDAIQESLLILSRKVGSLRAAAAFSSWLFATSTIAFIRASVTQTSTRLSRSVVLPEDIIPGRR